MRTFSKCNLFSPAGLIAALVLSHMSYRSYSSDPAVSNVTAVQRAGDKQVDIDYDVSDAEGDTLTISVEVSTNRGATYDLSVSSFTGSGYGYGVAPGTDKAIVWDAGTDWNGNYSTQMRVRVVAEDGIYPPNPEDTAGGTENGVVSLLSSNVAFLYSGTNAVQSGMAEGTIEDRRVAVLRGRVVDSSGDVLKGVIVTVEGHSEYGQTVTRTNGCYDMVVNGGGALNLNCLKADYLPVQRTIDVPWQDYVGLDDITMLHADSNLTTVALGSRSLKNGMQVAEGSTVTDQDGTRRAAVMIPAGVEASVFTEEGATQSIESLTTRFTEYTVGTNGPSAMPGDLPPTVAYTYCVELGSEEAQAKVAGRDVVFNTQVYFYVENFLGMPAGIGVPMGYYDGDGGAWVPSEDGLVIDLKGTNSSGLAEIDADGDGAADSASALAALGFTDAEREKLAADYSPTQSLWRVPIEHFSTYDCNYGVGAVAGAAAAAVEIGTIGQQVAGVEDPVSSGGMGDVEIETRVFREQIPVACTPYSLCYASRRTAGYTQTLTIPLSGATVSSELKRIYLEITVAGQKYTNAFSADPDQNYEFIWDGLDAYGRVVYGEQPVRIRIGYAYQGYYLLPARLAGSFGTASGLWVPGNIPARQDVVMWTQGEISIGCPPAPSQGMGGWTLSVHHTYDPLSGTIELGTGERRDMGDRIDGNIMLTVAGDGYVTNLAGRYTGDGVPATNSSLSAPAGVVAASDGSIYIGDSMNHRVRCVSADGTISTVAGTGSAGYSGDGGPATNAALNHPTGLAIGPDGSIYVADCDNCRIRKIDTNGVISTVAGNGTPEYSGDDDAANSAGLKYPDDVDVAADGTIYIADRANHRVRRVGPDGIITTAAGNGSTAFSGDGGPATNAGIYGVYSIAIGLDGSVYLTDNINQRVRRVSPGGIITTVAGNGTAGFSGDGGAATNANLKYPVGVDIGLDGTLYISDQQNHRIRHVGADGVIRTVAGDGLTTNSIVGRYNGDSAAATASSLNSPAGISVGPDGGIYIADKYNQRIRLVAPAFPGLQASDVLIPSRGADQVHVFNSEGRHEKTCDSLTGSNLFVFAYDTDGFLSSITDGDGNVTAISRDGDGDPTTIAGPYGQTTALTLNSDGYLASVENPVGETTLLEYATNGLLTSVTGARGSAYEYTVTYSSAGRVTRAADPAGGTLGLGLQTLTNGWQVASTTLLGRVTTACVESLATGDRRRIQTEPSGKQTVRLELSNGTETNMHSDGSVMALQYAPDPRFGMQSPYRARSVVTLPSGLGSTTDMHRAAAVSGGSLLNVIAVTNTVTLNGGVFLDVYTASNRTTRLTSPEGRTSSKVRDFLGRVTAQQVGGLAAVSNYYDSMGRLTNITVGSGGTARNARFQYDSAGFVCAKTDALGNNTVFERDLIGRMTNVVLPNGGTVRSSYDAHGNLTSVTPPGRSAHVFTYNLVDQVSEYVPPASSGVTGRIEYAYDADRSLTRVYRESGQTVTNTYDGSGRLAAVAISAGAYDYTHLTNGFLSSVSSPAGVTISNLWDGTIVGSVKWGGPVTGVVGRVFDSNFRVSSLSVNGGNTMTFGYDADGLLTNAGDCGITRSSVNTLIAGIKLDNISDSLEYNEFGEITNCVSKFNGSNLYSYSCAHDKLGRITSRVEVVLGVTNVMAYGYDSVGRLVQAVTNGAGLGTNIYWYDANGNRTNFAGPGVSLSGLYDGQDKLLRYGNSTNFYSANGDLTNRVSAGLSTRYAYDAFGNLLNAQLPGPTNMEYVIDGMNRRIGKKVEGVLTNGFLFSDALHPIAEYGDKTNLVSVFVYGSRENVPDYIVKTGTTYRVVSDHLGSPRLIVNSDNGDIMQRIDYDEFGVVASDTRPGYQPFGFAGGLYDHDTGLVRFGARDYNPETGRWTTKDAALFETGQWNLYSYSDNNPVNLIDTSGFGPGRPAGSPYDHEIAQLEEEIKDLQDQFNQEFFQYASGMSSGEMAYSGATSGSRYNWTAGMTCDIGYGGRVDDLARLLDAKRSELKKLERERRKYLGQSTFFDSVMETFGM